MDVHIINKEYLVNNKLGIKIVQIRVGLVQCGFRSVKTNSQ